MRLQLLVVLLLALATDAKGRARKARTKGDRSWKQRKRDCETDKCGDLVPDENMNCVNQCTSDECYDQIYAAEPVW
jgi:hypothetical protein